MKSIFHKLFRTRSIVSRLTAWYVLSSFFLVLFATTYLYWSVTKTLSIENKAMLENRLQTVRSLLKRTDALQSIKRRVASEWPLWHFEKIYVKIVDANNNCLVETPNIPVDLSDELFSKIDNSQNSSWIPAQLSGSRFKTRIGHIYVGLADHLTSKDEPLNHAKIFLVLDLNHEKELIRTYQEKLAIVLILALIICVIGGVWLSNSGFRPVQEIINTASRIKSTTLYERISEHHLPEELKILAATINEMLDRLKGSFDSLSQFSSDIAHELRTPINNLRGELEVALGRERSKEEYQEILQSSLEESIRLSKIIDSLLFLAQAENPNTQLKKDLIQLDTEIAKIVEFYEPIASEEGISINLSVATPVLLNVERTLFQRAIANIISNAINYTPKGGVIKIGTTTNTDHVDIVVADTGNGISEEHLPKIFDRFYRSDSSRTSTRLGGFGLGLALVKSIVGLHGGSIEIRSKPNIGTTVIMKFKNATAL